VAARAISGPKCQSREQRGEQAHDSVTDQKERSQLNQAAGEKIIVHRFLSSAGRKHSNGSWIFAGARHCGRPFAKVSLFFSVSSVF
jgi:hypothetical protein